MDSSLFEPRSRLAFALDYPNLTEARAGAEKVCAHMGVLKVGLELFVKEGPAATRLGADLGCDIFLDLKLHDIEKTVERAVGTACSLGVKYLTLHASGGSRMLEAAQARAEREATGLCLLGVTVLTSLDDADLREVGIDAGAQEQVKRLSLVAKNAGLGGLVCSSNEVDVVRSVVGSQMTLVTPGIRPFGSDLGDQKRVGTPQEAIARGADILVIGRPIRDAADPAQAAFDVLASISEARR
jgi:orotidine-5'-phosphate decarboxylase